MDNSRRATRTSLSRRFLFAACLVLGAPLSEAADRPSGAAVAAPDRYGAQVAREVLKAGGNAVDAAVAVGFALAVSHPQAGNLGGGGFMTLYVDGRPYFLDYREVAPAAASRDMFLDAHGEVVPELSLVGHRAAAVPGTVRGLWAAHQRFARLSWQRDLAPALRLARAGIVVGPELAALAAEANAHFAGRTDFGDYYGHLAAGRRWRQPELAQTLTRIARDGDGGFYKGVTAKRLVAEMARGGGLITVQDLADYRPVWREPLVRQWRDFTVVTAPPPSSGGIGLIQLLQMKDALAPSFHGLPLNSPQYVHLLAEIEKRVFADRAEHLGDPDFVQDPVAALLDPTYLRARAAEVDRVNPSPTLSVHPGLGDSHHQTTHFSIVDRDGNAVSNTYTLNDDFGSGVVVAGAGFLLNNEMDDFAAKPGAPNYFGVVGGDANAITPHKRPLSSMTPTILTRDGSVCLVIGTEGGSRIFTSIFQVLINRYEHALSLADAVAQPRVHHQLLPENTLFEEPYAQVPAATRDSLVARGYRWENQGWNGDIQAVEVSGGVARGVSDPRGVGVSLQLR